MLLIIWCENVTDNKQLLAFGFDFHDIFRPKWLGSSTAIALNATSDGRRMKVTSNTYFGETVRISFFDCDWLGQNFRRGRAASDIVITFIAAHTFSRIQVFSLNNKWVSIYPDKAKGFNPAEHHSKFDEIVRHFHVRFRTTIFPFFHSFRRWLV